MPVAWQPTWRGDVQIEDLDPLSAEALV